MSAIWHDIECGSYVEDLALWRSLAEEYGDPVLDIGAGTGRIAVDLARRGHRVTALDNDPDLVSELATRAQGLALEPVLADARSFELEGSFALCIVPMQTIQLLGGSAGRASFLRCGLAHLSPGGVLAVALSPVLDLYEVGHDTVAPLPDVREVDGVVYASQPVAVRADADGFLLERRREIVTPAGERSVQENRIRLDRLDPDELEHEARATGLTPSGRAEVPATADYVGSVVVMLRA